MPQLIKKRDLAKVLLEIIGIAFAVFLGMWVNEWNEKRKKEQKVQQLYTAIVKEIENNQSELIEIIADNKKQLETLNQYLRTMREAENNNTVFEHDLSKLGWSHNSAILKDIAWDAANVSNLTIELEFDLLKSLSSIYNGQKLYNDYSINLLKEFSSLSADLVVDKDKRRALHIHRRNIKFSVAISEDLNQAYLEFLKNHKKQP